MRANNIPEILINWIQKLYKSLEIKLIVNKDLTRSILVLQGLRQGDPISSIIFSFLANIMLLAANRILKGLQHLASD